MAQGTLFEVIKALYGLPTSYNRLHAHLQHTLREMGFKPTHFDPDVYIRGREGGNEYIGTHTDEILVVAVDPTSIFGKLKETYTRKAFRPTKVHLGYNYAQDKQGDTTWSVMGSTTYITEFHRNACALLKVATLRKDKLTCIPGDHPELYSSPILSEAQHRLYQQLFGMVQWEVQIGRLEGISSIKSNL